MACAATANAVIFREMIGDFPAAGAAAETSGIAMLTISATRVHYPFDRSDPPASLAGDVV
jgi:hypothetical protein